MCYILAFLSFFLREGYYLDSEASQTKRVGSKLQAICLINLIIDTILIHFYNNNNFNNRLLSGNYGMMPKLEAISL